MASFCRIGGIWRSGVMHGRVAGVWKAMTAHGRVAGAWKNFTPPSTNPLTTNPPTGSNSYSGFAPGNAAVTITSPVSANWTFTLLSGSATNISFGATTGLSTNVTATSGSLNTTYEATYRVTDTLSGWYVDVYVSARQNDFS